MEYKEYNLQTTLNFGKYKDKSIEFLISNDLGYLCWCIKEIKGFVVENDVLLMMNENYSNLSKSSRVDIGFIFGEKSEKEEIDNIIKSNILKRKLYSPSPF